MEAELEYADAIYEIRLTFTEVLNMIGFKFSNAVANATLPKTLIEEEVVVGEGIAFELNGTLTLPKEHQESLPAVILV